MTPPERHAVRSLAAARAGLSLDRDSHVPGLVTACRQAMVGGDGVQAFLLADRLCRITGGREALPFLLRAGALALLGAAEAAKSDLEVAAELNPDHPLVLEALLTGTDPAIRLEAAKRAAVLPETPERAWPLLAEAGLSHVIRLSVRDDRLHVEAIWRGASSFTLTLAGGSPLAEETILATARGPGAYDHAATIERPWPAGWPSLVATVKGAPARAVLVAPAVLLAEQQAPPENDRGPGPPGLLVVVPVYGDAEATREALDALFAAREGAPPTRIVVIDDASPEPAISAHVAALAEAGSITLIRNEANLGFAASVNAGLALRQAGEDALLLNADAFLPARALARLRAVMETDASIGTVTPFSNNGEDTSIPVRLQANDLPGAAQRAFIDRLAEETNQLDAVEMPNGVGFCLYIRGALLDAIGGFSVRFERGYYEDVDFCLRARQAGFRNVCATGLYVGHAGSRSFGAAKRPLVRRNLARLTARYPQYRAESRLFMRDDPLRPALARLEEAFVRSLAPPRLVVAPGALPEAILDPILDNLPPGPLETLLLAADETDDGLACRLRGVTGPFPVDLAFPVPAGADPVAMLRALLPQGLGELLLIDPGRLPAGFGQALCRMTSRIALAVADQEALRLPPLPWLPAAPAILLAAPALGAFAREAFPGAALQVLKRPDLPREPRAPWNRVERLLAVLPQGRDPQEMALARALAHHLSGRDVGVVLVADGELEDMAGAPVWITGAIPRPQLAHWLRRIGIAACLLPSRRYAAADPVGEALAAQGFAVARWQRAFAPVPHLDLPPDMPDAEAVGMVAAWFESLVAARVTAAR